MQTPGHPWWGRTARVEVPDRDDDEPVAASSVFDPGWRRATFRWRHYVSGVAEGDAVAGCELTSETADGQAVATVRADREVDNDVVELQCVHRVGTDNGVRRHDEDAGVVVAKTEFTRGADHPVGDVAVGLSRADLEATREHRAR